MQRYMRFREWPLRLKMSIFFIGGAAMPLLAVTLIEFSHQRQQIIEHVNALLTARADEVSSALDEFNGGYLRSAMKLSRLPEVRRYIRGSDADHQKMAPALTALLGALLAYFFAAFIEENLYIFLSLTAGFFIYISASDLIPSLHEKLTENRTANTLIFLTGIMGVYIFKAIFE